MLIPKLIILSIYLHMGEPLKVPTVDQSDEQLSSSLLNVLCSTNSVTIRLLIVDDEKFDYVEELVTRLNEKCPFKTVLLFDITAIPTTTVQYYSEVTVYMVYSDISIQNFRNASASYQGPKNSRFVVVFQFDYDFQLLADIFERLARQTISNIVVIMRSGYLEEVVLQYNPFDKAVNIVEDVSTLESTDLFMRNGNDLCAREFVVSMHEQVDRAIIKKHGLPGYDGIDGEVADLLKERMNLSYKYITPHEMFNGNRNSGVVGDLTIGDADISFNADSRTELLVGNVVDATVPFERNDMCVLVPKAGNQPNAWNLLRTMSKCTWVITILSIVAMMWIYRWTQSIQKLIYVRKYPFYEYAWKDIATIVFQSFFGDAIRRIPQSMPLRIVIISWCTYSFLITNAFQAKLISSLVLPKALDDINTFEQLGHSNLKIMYPRTLAHLINEYTDNRTMNMLSDQLEVVESLSDFDAYINNKSSTSAFIMMRFHADLMQKRNFDKIAKKPFYRIMDQCFLTFPRVYYVRLGSMYVNHVSEVLHRFHESGFIVKWTRHAEFINGIKGNIPVDDIEEEVVDEGDIKVVITPEHLQTSFILLALGLFGASLAFLGERIHFQRNRRRVSSVQKS